MRTKQEKIALEHEMRCVFVLWASCIYSKEKREVLFFWLLIGGNLFFWGGKKNFPVTKFSSKCVA